MVHRKSLGWALSVALLLAGGMAAGEEAKPCPAASEVQPAAHTESQLAGDWRSSAPARITTATAPQSAADLGIAPTGTKLDRMLLLLQPSSAQTTALDAELSALQSAGSCSYHQWLTPQQFAEKFSVSAGDAAAVAAWLSAQGFTVAPLPAGRGWIEFSGTVAQVEQAFAASVHTYSTQNGNTLALTGTISVPQAFAPVVKGLVSLDGAFSTAAITSAAAVAATPDELVNATSAQQAEAVTPQRIASILHLDTLHSAGKLGAGESIAIAARSGINLADVEAFRTAFSLPQGPAPVVADSSVAVSNTAQNPDSEAAEFAAEWATAAAPRARIVVVSAASTAATDGIDLSLASIVGVALAHTAVVGYSACEPALSAAHQAFYAALYRQAAAEGISIIAATGDSGAAACHVAGSDASVTTGYNVSGLAATQWNTTVGALEWNSNSALAAWSPVNPSDPAYASGGGSSLRIAAPAWQFAATNGKMSSMRSLPDIALPAAMDSASNRGLAFCFSSSDSATSCTLMRAGGSSASAAIFGGISALLAEKYGAQGNLDPGLYALNATSGVFADVAEGNARLQCVAGSSGCDVSGKIGYAAASGYDQATGLGSVNADALIKAWPQAVGTNATTVTLTVSPTTLTPGIPEALTAVINAAQGVNSTATITGTVSFYDGSTLIGTQTVSSFSATMSNVSLDTSKSHLLTAVYSGDDNWAPATSSPVSLIAAPLTDTITLAAAPTSAGPGQSISFTATVNPTVPPAATLEQNPTGTVTFYNGTTAIGTAALLVSLGNSSTATFTSASLPAGTDTITAVYAGDSYYQPGTSNAVTVTVQDFAIVGTSSTPSSGIQITQGSSAKASFVVSGLGGFTGQIQVVCNVPAQDNMTCSPSPALVTPTATVTFTVQTTTSGSASAAPKWLHAAGGAALAMVLVLAPIGRKARGLRWMALVLLLAGMCGAGMGCSNTVGPPSGTYSGTPLGVSTLTITATAYENDAVVSHSVYLPVNVAQAQ